MKYRMIVIIVLVFVSTVSIIGIHRNLFVEMLGGNSIETVNQPMNYCGENGAYYITDASDSLVFEDGLLVGVK